RISSGVLATIRMAPIAGHRSGSGLDKHRRLMEKEGTVMSLFARRAALARRWLGRRPVWAALCAGVLIAAGLAAVSGAVKAAGIIAKKNGKIAFVTLRDQFDQEIYSINPDGSQPTR